MNPIRSFASYCFILTAVVLSSFLALGSPAFLAAQERSGPAAAPRIDLREGWQIQSSCKVAEKGEAISSASFAPQGWRRASVPGPVVANLVADKVEGYPDPYTGMELRKMPGADYPIGAVFSQLKMSESNPFRCSWWYRATFAVPAANQGKQNWLNFRGINYRANVWLNGRPIAGTKQIAGAWRTYELNVSSNLLYGQPNGLAVEVFAPGPNDLGINFVDWNPMPPDKNMGLWREVYIAASGPVALRDPFVDTKLEGEAPGARLNIYADVRNGGDQPVKGSLEVEIEDIKIAQPVELAPGQTREVSFAPEQYPQLHLKHPRLWWPAKLGPQNLYTAQFRFVVEGAVSDTQSIRFGVREVTSEFTSQGARLFKINRKNILIRGGGWSFDMLLRTSDERLEQEMKYALDMNLNTIRLEGKIETRRFFDLADQTGMLVMAGWCCCDFWEKWKDWNQEDKDIAAESLRSQLLRMRSHPSLVMWLNGSDNPPVAEVETRYLEVEKQVHWPTPIVSSASRTPTQVTGPSGVKMTGPYEYVPPAYWLQDTKRGGAYGFNTETSPGPAIPPPQSIRKFIPPDHLWPIDEVWNYHAGGGEFKNLKVYTAALDQRYGPSASMEEFSLKSQAAAYEGERAMFEAYLRNKYTSTGVIQWMLNNAWPSMIWHLYDWYLMPGGGYFGTKKANEPLHVQYSREDDSVFLVNSFYQPFPRMKVRAQVLNFDMKPKFEKEATVDAGPDSSARVFAFPPIEGLTPVYFIRLWLADESGKTISDNFYWRSTKSDVLDWDHSKWYYTPARQMEDFTSLKTLPTVVLNASAVAERHADQTILHVTVRNPGKALGFQVHLRATDNQGDDVLPALFEDNYFPLFPGEERVINVSFDARQFAGEPTVVVEGWNVQPAKLRAQAVNGNAPAGR